MPASPRLALFAARNLAVHQILADNQPTVPTFPARIMRNRLSLLLMTFLMTGCAAPEPSPSPSPSPEPVAALPEAKAQSDAMPPQKAAARAEPKAKKPGPIPTRALNVRAECNFRDETGYNGMMKLKVEHARVQTFEARVNIPKHGSCRFDMKNFRQTREMPNVELSHLRDPCIVRLWEQRERVTVAFQQCRKMCTGNAWEYLWPILTDTRDGSCA